MDKTKHILIAIPFATAAVLFITLLLSTHKNLQASDWDVVSGEANTTFRHGMARVTLHGHVRSSQRNAPFSYSYNYDGLDYRKSRIGFGVGNPSGDVNAGGYLRVYVNPSDPEESVLEPGWHKDHTQGVLLGVFFLGIGYTLMRRL